MDVNIRSKHARVRIIATSGPWKNYNGQECDAVLYYGACNAHIDTEQLKPPLPKYQQAKESDLQEIE